MELSESTLTGLLSLVTVSGAAFHLFMVVGYWRGDVKMVARMQSAMSIFSADTEKVRAHMRGPLAINLAVWGLALAAVCVFVSDAFHPAGDIEWLLAFGGIIVLFLGVGLDFMIIYLNQPKFLVPPRLRWEPGFRRVQAVRLAETSNKRREKAVRALYDSYGESQS
jgi:hypothetical protein